ncbi:tigger transposable element-derived protein 2-like [Melanaphis sacchari]|uniref:tigger transposable element-derived protein 2-like n=1 Tax=Melanaphis sacchari TaxID=742174 RepID=UPI000DC13A22|nr:tigger transposable element-derived protein 2-like [Melanaphis sacchari]
MVEREGYTKNDIYNADETSINWKALPRKSLASHCESSTSGYKISENRITAMVFANASGYYALLLLVIGKAIKPWYFKNINRLLVTYKVQKIKQERKCKGRKGKVMLLLDNAPSHPSTKKLNMVDPDFNVMFFPANTTTIIFNLWIKG